MALKIAARSGGARGSASVPQVLINARSGGEKLIPPEHPSVKRPKLRLSKGRGCALLQPVHVGVSWSQVMA